MGTYHREPAPEVTETLRSLSIFFGLGDKANPALALELSNKISFMELKKATARLKDSWTKRYFPMLPDFMEAIAFNRLNATDSRHEAWRYEYAAKLGIPVEQLPIHASYLTEGQRRTLGLPDEAERKILVSEIHRNLRGSIVL